MNNLFLFIATLTGFICRSYCDGFLLGTVEMCQVVRQIDCLTHYQAQGDETLCCTDGNTYTNKCLYVQAKCIDMTLDVVHVGNCSHAPSITVSTPPTIKNYNISEEFCQEASKYQCPDTIDPLCGTDFLFYLNLCVFNRAKCQKPELQIQTLSNCKDDRKGQKRIGLLKILQKYRRQL